MRKLNKKWKTKLKEEGFQGRSYLENNSRELSLSETYRLLQKWKESDKLLSHDSYIKFHMVNISKRET